jgi:hypothetical protein
MAGFTSLLDDTEGVKAQREFE